MPEECSSLRCAGLCLYALLAGYSSFGYCGLCTRQLISNRMIFFLPFQECLEFFNIPETQSSHYFLMDKRWNLIHYNKVRQWSGPDDFVLPVLNLF